MADFQLTLPFDLGRGLARLNKIKGYFTTLSAAFDKTSGHKHDGTDGNGAAIADTTALANATAAAYKAGFVSADAPGRGLMAAGYLRGDKVATGLLTVELVNGQDETGDDTIPVTGLAVGDELVACFVYVTKAAISTKTQRALTDFTVGADNLTVVANKANNTNNQYEVWWINHTP